MFTALCFGPKMSWLLHHQGEMSAFLGKKWPQWQTCLTEFPGLRPLAVSLGPVSVTSQADDRPRLLAVLFSSLESIKLKLFKGVSFRNGN